MRWPARIVVILSLVSCGDIVPASEWTRHHDVYGHDEIAHGVAVDDNGLAYVVGRTKPRTAGEEEAFVVAYDEHGNIVWETLWGVEQPGGDVYWAVAADADVGVFAVGHTGLIVGHQDATALVRAFSPEGEELWTAGGHSETVGLGVARDVVVMSDGDVAVLGTGETGPDQDFVFWLVRYSAWGDRRWEATYADFDTTSRLATGLGLASDDSLIVAASVGGSLDEDVEPLLLRFDGDGTLLWEATPVPSGRLVDVVVDDADRIYAVGQTGGDVQARDRLIVAVTLEGQTVWSNVVAGTVDEWNLAESVALGPDEGILVGSADRGGPTQSLAGWVAEYDRDGTLLWSRILDGAGHREVFGVAAYPDGHVIAVGYEDRDNDEAFTDDAWVQRFLGGAAE